MTTLAHAICPSRIKEKLMLDSCIIAGDSNAVTLAPFVSECTLVGRPGINSWQFNGLYPQHLNAETVVIALATNDHRYIRSADELRILRARITAKRVFWILPSGNLPASGVSLASIQAYVRAAAAANGDIVVLVPSTQADRLHPSWAAGCTIAAQVRQVPHPPSTPQERFCASRQ